SYENGTTEEEDGVGLVAIHVKYVYETGNWLASNSVGKRDEIILMGSEVTKGELTPTGSGMSDKSPMGRRDNMWGEVDFFLGGGEDDDASPVDERFKSIAYSVGCEVDSGMALVESVGSSVGGVEE
ncbi:hypothetical protein KI387_037783, partial [Taxus chinensis]